MSAEYYPLLILLLTSSGLAVVFDLSARWRRQPHADSGDFWVFIVKHLCFYMGGMLLLSMWSELIKPIWDSGYHLYFDILLAPTGWPVNEWTLQTRYLYALSIPVVFWAFLLILKLIWEPRDKISARWLAGRIDQDDKSSRFWVMIYAVPFILILLFTYQGLNSPGGYPAALWSTLLLLIISIFGVAFSMGKPDQTEVKARMQQSAEQALELQPWPLAIRAQGIQLKENVAFWPATASSRAIQGQYAQNLADKLQLMGAKKIAPELIESIAALLSPEQDSDMKRLVFAPDNCGQLETVALAATILEQRYYTSTLVIVANGAKELVQRFIHCFIHWGVPKTQVVALGIDSEIEKQTHAQIWVVDADILSDLLMPMMKQHRRFAEKVGLVIWWHLETYTGVLGANLWAISRRLERLLQVKGREDIRVLALVRQTAHADDQITRFVSRLMPPSFSTQTTVHVPRHFAHDTQVHLIESHQEFFRISNENKIILEQFRHLALITAKASVNTHWRTHLKRPANITELEAKHILELIDSSVDGNKLYSEATEADVCLCELSADDVLSLSEIISQGGRASDTQQPHHIGLILPDNPYVTYLLTSLMQRRDDKATDFGFGLSRRLVGAEPHPSVISRHLLMALSELPDTKENLTNTLLEEEHIINETLDNIANSLSRYEVRYLRKKHAAKPNEPQLAISVRYQTTQTKNLRQPLDTVSLPDDLIDIKDPTKGDKAVLKRIDPERMTILAYPHQIFVHEGRRYHIREWNKKTVLQQKYILCEEETRYAKTWRIRHLEVYDITAQDAAVDTSHKAGAFMRFRASLKYEERVTGALVQQFDLTAGEGEQPERIMIDTDISQTIATKALILGFPELKLDSQLYALCQVLRYIIPVHLGVNENALEVVKFEGEDKNGLPVYGVAIVDLYPNGIGLIDAIYDDHKLILKMWEWGLKWLEQCACQSDKGCPACLRTVSALAAVGDDDIAWPQRHDAITILKEVIKV